MTRDGISEWSSLHLFIGRPGHADALALFAAETMARHAADAGDWFFIRYPEGGVHVRLRIGPAAAAFHRDVNARMAQRCRDLVAGSEVSPWIRTFGVPDAAGDIHAPGEAIAIPYAAETVRYGGPSALLINEQLFRVSTAIAVKVIGATRDREDLRAQIAADLMMAAVAAMARQVEAQDFFSHYAAGWRTAWPHTPPSPPRADGDRGNLQRHFQDHVAALRDDRPAKGLAHRWGRTLVDAQRRFRALFEGGELVSPTTGQVVADENAFGDAIRHMIASQIHMLNNRLGLWPDSEIILSEQLTHRLCGDGHDAVAAPIPPQGRGGALPPA